MATRVELPGAAGTLPATPTALIVEDCLYSAEALRLMCRACGLRSRHAATLEAAERHLAIFRPAFAIVDIGLPDGSGVTLLNRIARDTVRPKVLAISADPARLADPSIDGLVDARCEKPIASAQAFHAVLRSMGGLALAEPRRGAATRPDGEVLTLELARIRETLDGAAEPGSLELAAGRLEGLAAELGEWTLRSEARDGRLALADATRGSAQQIDRAGLVARLSALISQIENGQASATA
ncbi:MAG: response regulator [Pseudomonadota bacterium]